MRVPTVKGIIDRRILANFRIDPEVLDRVLPSRFRPKVINGYAIGGICLIRLKKVRPLFMPIPWGVSSENAAHRFAVEWEEDGVTKEGVFIPRRDTNSRFNTFAGGRIFPGIHYHANFIVKEVGDYYSVTLESDDSDTRVHVSGRVEESLPEGSVFSSVEAASEFFEQGAVGYSITNKEGVYDGLELKCRNWEVFPLGIERVESSYFEKESRFPKGSVEFDCALLMKNIDHQWHSREDICCPASVDS